MNIHEAVKFLDGCALNKREGLPDEIFYFISRTTPMVNVDLLVKSENGRTLMAWRNDQYAGTGWHIPGGIVRYKESFHTRIQKTALNELGTEIKFDEKPLAVNEIILPEYENRAHFISLLYRCYTPRGYEINNKNLRENDVGFLRWHEQCPDNILSVQNLYREYI